MVNIIRKFSLMLSAILGAATMIAMPSTAAAQDAASDGRALLVTPLSFVKDTDLDFGVIVPTDNAGTVVMDSTGAVTTTGGVVVLTGTQQPARFWGYGSFGQFVRINLDANTYLLTRQGGSETMLWDQVTIGSTPPIVIGTTPRFFFIGNPDGYFSFTIAGRLQVGADQEPGIYDGTFTVTLDYL